MGKIEDLRAQIEEARRMADEYLAEVNSVSADAEEAAQVAALEEELDRQLLRMAPNSASDEVVLAGQPEPAPQPLFPPPPPAPNFDDSEGDN